MKRFWCAVLAVCVLLVAGCEKQEPYFGTFSDEESGTVENSKKASNGAEKETSEGDSEETLQEETEEALYELEKHQFTNVHMVTDSDAYCVLDDAGEAVLGKNELKAFAPASITKVMTALTAIDHVNLTDPVTITEAELTENIAVMSSGIYPSFKPGETVTVKDLLYALILPSTNAAGNILATHIAGSTPEFARLMNRKAEELGCQNSHFMNAHGLDTEGHYVCAYDMALILRAAVQNDDLREVLSAKSYTVPATAYNPERTIFMGHGMVNGSYECAGVFAGKSGSTLQAKQTLVTAVEREGQRLYVCTLHSDDYLATQDTDNLINYAYTSLRGSYPISKNIIHDFKILRVDDQGMDISCQVDNGGISARFVFWDMAKGTGEAVFKDLPEVTQKLQIHLPFPYKAAYMLQVFVTGDDGVERVTAKSVLYNGGLNGPGIKKFNGCDYVIGDDGFMRTGSVETMDGCYVTLADGSVGHGFVGGKFYAGPDGKIVTGWFNIDKTKYYAGADGRIVTGKMIIDGTEYEFSEDGGYLLSP